MEHSKVDRDNCDRVYDGDLDVCYYELGDVFVDSGIYLPHEWWPLMYKDLTEGPTTTSSTTTRPHPIRQYQPNQYGCHDDGRCLDDYDTWCDEADLIEFEPTGEILCPDSYDAMIDNLLDRIDPWPP